MNKITNVIRRLDLPRIWRVETFRSDKLNDQDRRFGRILEIIVVATILAIAARGGANTYIKNLDSAAFYQTYFGPAVNFACNGEFNQIKSNDVVQQFLERKSNNLNSCSGVEGAPTGSISGLESSMVYLELITGVVWKVLGFTWKNLYVVAAVLTAGFALAIYCLLRVFSESRLASTAFTFAILYSAPILIQIPHLRDFAKAPFLIGALACIGASVFQAHRLLSILLFATAAGAMISIGYGFRPDVKVALPIAIIAPVLFFHSGTCRFIAVRACLVWIGVGAGYLAFQLPLNVIGSAAGPQAASFIPHVFILGFAEQFLQAGLGMAEASYSVLRPYLDDAVFGAANLYGTDQLPIVWGSTKYTQVSADLLRSILLLVPHDSLLRIFYTGNAIGHLPINNLVWGIPILSALPLILFARPRELLFTAITFGTLISVLSLQYDERHAFYMVVLGAIMIVIFGSALLDITRRIRAAGFHLPKGIGLQSAFMLSAATSLVAIFAAASWLLYTVQERALRNLAQIYSNLDWQPIEFRVTRNGIEPTHINTEKEISSFLLTSSIPGAPPAPRTPSGFLRLRVKSQPTDTSFVPLPAQLFWTALQGKIAHNDTSFTFSSSRAGYAVESNSISGADFSKLAVVKQGDSKVWLRVTGETLAGAVYVGVLNQNKSGFAFNDRLPHGKWQYIRQFNITADLGNFSILFTNAASARNTVRVDSIELLALPKAGCWAPGATLTADYKRLGEAINLGGVVLPHHAQRVAYYFPETTALSAEFTGLALGGISPDCIVDWSVAKNFPAGTVPAELLLVDDQLRDFHRGNWLSIWQDFIN